MKNENVSQIGAVRPRRGYRFSLFVAVSALAAAFMLHAANAAVVFQLLHSFASANGENPYKELVRASDGNLYGTAYSGGASNAGTVFRMTTNGQFTLLHSLLGGTNGYISTAALVQGADSQLYGATLYGGGGAAGTIFRITTNGTFTQVHSFEGGTMYANSFARASDGNLYGTTSGGGNLGLGTVFRLTTNGAFTTLYSFTGASDGESPMGLVQAPDGKFYGTAYRGGGSLGRGTVFQITTNGALTPLYVFGGGNDGQNPRAKLLYAIDGRFYGTTESGGAASSYGTIFRISTSGSYTQLYAFARSIDGGCPMAGLVQRADGMLYGTASCGGNFGEGTAFSITTNGTFTPFYSFAYSTGGAPSSSLVQASDGNLYGTTPVGGAFGAGTIFRFAFPPPSGPPIVSTLAASNLTSGSAVLRAMINPSNLMTTAHFQWGTTTNYGNLTAATNLANSGASFLVMSMITNLASGTLFHYRARASNSMGIVNGTDMSFVTSDMPREISKAVMVGAGQFQIEFVGGPDVSYTVLMNTNIAAPLSNWIVSGQATQLAAGVFRFIDAAATNTQRFYLLRNP